MAMINHRPFHAIARQFGLKKDALLRHYDNHLPETLAKAAEQEDVRRAIDYIAQFKAINAAAIAILSVARRTGDHDLALRAIDRVQKHIELQAKLIGELDERPVINVLLDPQWLAIRTALLAALLPYPEARAGAAQSLLALEAGNGSGG